MVKQPVYVIFVQIQKPLLTAKYKAQHARNIQISTTHPDRGCDIAWLRHQTMQLKIDFANWNQNRSYNSPATSYDSNTDENNQTLQVYMPNQFQAPLDRATQSTQKQNRTRRKRHQVQQWNSGSLKSKSPKEIDQNIQFTCHPPQTRKKKQKERKTTIKGPIRVQKTRKK